MVIFTIKVRKLPYDIFEALTDGIGVLAGDVFYAPSLSYLKAEKERVMPESLLLQKQNRRITDPVILSVIRYGVLFEPYRREYC